MLYFHICKLIRYAKIDLIFSLPHKFIRSLHHRSPSLLLFHIFFLVMHHTYCWHMLIKSLSVVHCWRPLMYKFVFDKVSWTCGVPFGPMVVFVLLRLVLKVPLCEPVFDELLEFVLLGDAAVGTRVMYYKMEMRKTGSQYLNAFKFHTLHSEPLNSSH